MVRVINNSTLRKQVPDDTLLEYRKECKRAKAVRLVIPKDWQDHTGKFQNYVGKVSAALNINWFNVALVYCENSFDEEKTVRRCQKLRRALPQRNVAPFDNDPYANPWYFMNEYLNKFKTVPSFADHIAENEADNSQ